MLMGFLQSFSYAEIAGMFGNKSVGASVCGAMAWLRYSKFIAPLSARFAWSPVLSLGCAIATGYIIFNFLNLNAGWIHRMDSGHIQRPWKAPTWQIWALALAAVLVLFLLGERLSFAARYPANAVAPLADWITAIMQWLKANVTWLTRLITTVLNVPPNFALELLAKGFKIGRGLEAIPIPGCRGLASSPQSSWLVAPMAASNR